MTTVVLTDADIGLFTRYTATRITIPHLIAANRDEVWDEAAVYFDTGEDGPVDPVGYRGQTRAASVQCTARFGERQHTQMVALLDLFRAARTAGDGRLQLRTHAGQVGGLDELTVGSVRSWPATRVAANVWDVTFTVERRAWSLDELAEPLITWADVIDAYDTWADLIAAYPTWADLLAARSLT